MSIATLESKKIREELIHCEEIPKNLELISTKLEGFVERKELHDSFLKEIFSKIQASSLIEHKLSLTEIQQMKLLVEGANACLDEFIKVLTLNHEIFRKIHLVSSKIAEARSKRLQVLSNPHRKLIRRLALIEKNQADAEQKIQKAMAESQQIVSLYHSILQEKVVPSFLPNPEANALAESNESPRVVLENPAPQEEFSSVPLMIDEEEKKISVNTSFVEPEPMGEAREVLSGEQKVLEKKRKSYCSLSAQACQLGVLTVAAVVAGVGYAVLISQGGVI